MAHELGHVCASEDDVYRRSALDGEWGSEMAADYYAYRWGFGRQIARHRANRDWTHHGVAPGHEFTTGPGVVDGKSDGIVRRWRVSRSFYIRFIQSETEDGRVIETAAQRREREEREVANGLAARGVNR